MTSTETPAGSQARRGCPGWMKLLLIASLAVNVAVVGLVIGQSVRGEERTARGSDRVIEWIVGMLPEERRDLALAHFDAARDRIAALRADRDRHLPAVVAALRAEPFDPQALEAALEAMFDRRYSSRQVIREHLITLLAQLTPEERAVFADRFEERLESRSERRD